MIFDHQSAHRCYIARHKTLENSLVYQPLQIILLGGGAETTFESNEKYFGEINDPLSVAVSVALSTNPPTPFS